jgi:beta-lactam-binding protein with PASTA domain
MLKILKTFAWTLPFIGFVAGYFFAHSFFNTMCIVAPSLVGRPIREVIKDVSLVGLNIRLYREKERADVEEGIVLEQSPKSGMVVKPNQNIFVTISNRPKSLKVPVFVGKKYNDAMAILKQERVSPKIFWIENSYPKNFCIAQNFSAAYFSLGQSKLFIFPDFRKKLLSDVKDSLDREGISVEIFYLSGKKNNSRPYDQLQVVDQKPMPGMIVDKSRQLYAQIGAS